MSEYRDSYEEEEGSQSNCCQHKSFIIIEQFTITFWLWFRGRRELTPKEMARIREDFHEVGIKAIILPPGCRFGD